MCYNPTTNTGIRARKIYRGLGYARWENFNNIMRRAIGLIASGEATGVISQITYEAPLGKGAKRTIPDYELDASAYKLVKSVSSGVKLHKHDIPRNECALLGLLQRYCAGKGIAFAHQKRLGGFVFDAGVSDSILIEFDEPHHCHARQRKTDELKNVVARDNQMSLLRFTVENDIIDMVLGVDSLLNAPVVVP